jgi:hypothetical protein
MAPTDRHEAFSGESRTRGFKRRQGLSDTHLIAAAHVSVTVLVNDRGNLQKSLGCPWNWISTAHYSEYGPAVPQDSWPAVPSSKFFAWLPGQMSERGEPVPEESLRIVFSVRKSCRARDLIRSCGSRRLCRRQRLDWNRNPENPTLQRPRSVMLECRDPFLESILSDPVHGGHP